VGSSITTKKSVVSETWMEESSARTGETSNAYAMVAAISHSVTRIIMFLYTCTSLIYSEIIA
jgi:hypothetical protein